MVEGKHCKIKPGVQYKKQIIEVREWEKQRGRQTIAFIIRNIRTERNKDENSLILKSMELRKTKFKLNSIRNNINN